MNTVNNKGSQLPHVYVYDLPLADELHIDYEKFYHSEKEQINSFLVRNGFELLEDEEWFSIEKDSFGPLSRGRIVRRETDNTRVLIWYG